MHKTIDMFLSFLREAFLQPNRRRIVGAYGQKFRTQLKGMGIIEVVTAPRLPWQKLFIERLIGSIDSPQLPQWCHSGAPGTRACLAIRVACARIWPRGTGGLWMVPWSFDPSHRPLQLQPPHLLQCGFHQTPAEID